MTIKNLKEFIDAVLLEAPINDYETIGDFSKRYSVYSSQDRKLVTNPVFQGKLKRIFEKTPYNFNIYVVNTPEAKGFVEIGEVSPSYLSDQMKLKPEDLSKIKSDPNSITIIYTNNSAAERVPLTGWTMAHRLGHAISASFNKSSSKEWRLFTGELQGIFTNILDVVYNVPYDETENALKFAAQQIGTMKSARDSNIRTWGEFAYELLAQYLLTGKITFKPLPDKLIVKNKQYFAEPVVQQKYSNDLEEHQQNLQSILGAILDKIVGKIFVM